MMNLDASQEVKKNTKAYHAPELSQLGLIPAVVANFAGGGCDGNFGSGGAASNSVS